MKIVEQTNFPNQNMSYIRELYWVLLNLVMPNLEHEWLLQAVGVKICKPIVMSLKVGIKEPDYVSLLEIINKLLEVDQ